jgi:hypothetical protein
VPDRFARGRIPDSRYATTITTSFTTKGPFWTGRPLCKYLIYGEP